MSAPIEKSIEQQFSEIFGPGAVMSTAMPITNTKPTQETKQVKTRKPKAKPIQVEEKKIEAPRPESPKKDYQFKWSQMKTASDILSTKLGIHFWIQLSKEEQEQEKEHPTDREFYRLSYCKYNNFPLLLIVRYYPDPSKKVKGKAYATINLNLIKCTMNSQNKIEFTKEEQLSIRKALALEETSLLRTLKHLRMKNRQKDVYEKMNAQIDEIDDIINTKDRMIEALEESEGQFAQEKVRYEMLYENTKKILDLQTQQFQQKENEYKEKIAEVKSDLLFFKVGIVTMIEDVEKLNKNFVSYKKLLDINMDKLS